MKRIKITENQFRVLENNLKENKTSSFFDILKSIIVIDNHFDIYDLPKAVANWPIDDSENGDNERLDLENFEILSLDETGMVMCCGGDWQTPKSFKVVEEGGQLTAIDVKSEPNYCNDGLGTKQIVKILNK